MQSGTRWLRVLKFLQDEAIYHLIFKWLRAVQFVWRDDFSILYLVSYEQNSFIYRVRDGLDAQVWRIYLTDQFQRKNV